MRYLRGANWDVPTALGIVILTVPLSLTVLPLVPDSAALNCTVQSASQTACVVFYCNLMDGVAISTRFCRSKLYSQLHRLLESSFTALSLTVLPLVPDSAALNCTVSFTDCLSRLLLHSHGRCCH